MAKIIHAIFGPVLKNFKPYRKTVGGKWYLVRIPDSGGWSSYIEYWTQERDSTNGVVIVKKEEDYTV